MDSPTTPAKTIAVNRWLPYWAVFQADLSQTLNSWVYRVWLLVSVLATIGYLLYRVGAYQEARIVQPASILIADLLRWSVVGSVTLIIVLTGGSISGERGTMADSVLSRGISRRQYYLGKLHARIAAVVGTFLGMGLLALAASFFLLHEDMSLLGSTAALAAIAALLTFVASCGVSVSAITNSSVVGIAVVWLLVHGTGFGISLAPSRFLTPDRVLLNLPNILRGSHDLLPLVRFMGWSLFASLLVSLVGMAYFSRRDV
jgi:hypothetical protein